MGLLDDAIREHLELKRLRGADPGEVAREQREALDPVPSDRHESADDGESALREVAPELAGQPVPAGATPAGDRHESAREPSGSTDPAQGVQETAELDMGSVLNEDGRGAADEVEGADSGASQPVVGESAADQSAADSLEWEIPSRPIGGSARGTSHGQVEE